MNCKHDMIHIGNVMTSESNFDLKKLSQCRKCKIIRFHGQMGNFGKWSKEPDTFYISTA